MRATHIRPNESSQSSPTLTSLRQRPFPVQAKSKAGDSPRLDPAEMEPQAGNAGRLEASFGKVRVFPERAPSTAISSGNPLSSPLRKKMEAAFKTDFSDVRIHQGPDPESLSALAFTQGRDIHFAPGQYDPGSATGQRIIAHELAHVVQQRQGRVSMPQGGGAPVNADPGLEAEADKIGEKAAQGNAVALGNVKDNSVSPTEGGIPAAIQCIRYRNLTSGEISDDLTAPPDNSGNWAPVADSAPAPRQSRRLGGQEPENSGLADTHSARSGGSMANLRTVPDDPWKPLNDLAHYGYQASEGRGLFYNGPVEHRGLGPQQVQTSIPARDSREHQTIFGQMTGGERSSTQYQQLLGTAAPDTLYEILHAMGHGEGGQMTQSPRNLASASGAPIP